MSIGLSQVHKCRATFLHANRVGQKATQSAESSAHFWHLAQVSESVICEKKFRTEIWSVCPVVWNIRRSRLTKSKLPYPVKNRAPIEDRSSTVIFWDEKLYCAYVPRLRERVYFPNQINQTIQTQNGEIQWNAVPERANANQSWRPVTMTWLHPCCWTVQGGSSSNGKATMQSH